MAKRLPIFQNSKLQKVFEKQGFVVIPDFISPDTIKYLDEFFDKNHTNLPDEGFVSDSYSGDFKLKELLSNEILKIFTPSYEGVFQNYQAFGGSFLYKMPSHNSELVMHQDWTIVDEEKYVAINCWVPLCDTSLENGTLMVLPGGHYDALPVYRAPTLDFFFTGNEDIVRSKLFPLEVKAGTAVILNQSLVHFSPANKSGKIRKAITAGVKSKGAPMLFCYKSPENKDELELYEMDENFLIRFDDFFADIMKKPVHGNFFKKTDYKLPQFNRDELLKVVNDMTEHAKDGNRILKSRDYDKVLEENGYVVIPFLNSEEISELKDFFYKNHSSLPKGLYASAHVQNTAFRKKMNDFIYQVFQRANAENFADVIQLGGTFMNKAPGKEGLLYPHQDWNIVDEEQFRSFNLWVPLVDTDATNGAIQILEKSHKLLLSIRSVNIPGVFENVYDNVWNRMKTLAIPAGHALIYDHRLLHASKENFSDSDRLVVVFGIIPDNADMRYYYKNENSVEEYACTPEFYLFGNPDAGPGNLKKLRTIAYDFPQLQPEQIEKSYENKKERSLFQKVKTLLGV